MKLSLTIIANGRRPFQRVISGIKGFPGRTSCQLEQTTVLQYSCSHTLWGTQARVAQAQRLLYFSVQHLRRGSYECFLLLACSANPGQGIGRTGFSCQLCFTDQWESRPKGNLAQFEWNYRLCLLEVIYKLLLHLVQILVCAHFIKEYSRDIPYSLAFNFILPGTSCGTLCELISIS